MILDENFGNIPQHADRVIGRLADLGLNWTPMTRLDLIKRNFDSWTSHGFAGALRGFVGRAYVAVVGASAGGLSVDPAFIGRIDAVSEATWPQPLLRVSGHADLRSGELVFGVNGRLIGLVTSSMDTTWIVPPETLEALVGQLTSKGSTQ